MPNLNQTPARTFLAMLFIGSALLAPLLLAACNDSPTPTLTPPTPSGGEAVFMRYCAVCHPGGHRGAGPDIIESIANSSDEVLTEVIRKGKGRMPPYNKATISDAQLGELIAYMRTLK